MHYLCRPLVAHCNTHPLLPSLPYQPPSDPALWQFMTSQTSIDMSLKHKEMVILGTMYAGEMKKGVFT